MTEAKPIRIWHPMYDAYHCSFRMLRLLAVNAALETEALFILDFYLLFPFLLHSASMPDQVRARFRELGVSRQKDQFLQIPSPESLYRDLSVIQNTSLVGLAAKGIIDPAAYKLGQAQLKPNSIPPKLRTLITASDEADAALVRFLVTQVAPIGVAGPKGLRSLTGLVRRRLLP